MKMVFCWYPKLASKICTLVPDCFSRLFYVYLNLSKILREPGCAPGPLPHSIGALHDGRRDRLASLAGGRALGAQRAPCSIMTPRILCWIHPGHKCRLDRARPKDWKTFCVQHCCRTNLVCRTNFHENQAKFWKKIGYNPVTVTGVWNLNVNFLETFNFHLKVVSCMLIGTIKYFLWRQITWVFYKIWLIWKNNNVHGKPRDSVYRDNTVYRDNS